MIKKLSFIKLYLLVGVPLLFTYSLTLKAFFQQDEWIAFGNALGASSLKDLLVIALAPNAGHYVPFHYLYFDLFFKLFGVSFVPWMVSSIIFHLVITYLVGLTIYKLFNNKYYALLAMLIFGFSASASQATTWAVADINTHGSTLFGFLSLLYLNKFIDRGKTTKKEMYLSILFFGISLLFKEVTIGVFVTLPVLFFVKLKNLDYKKVIEYSKPLVLVGFSYLAFRVLSILLFMTNTSDLITATQDKRLILFNIVTSPGKVFWQSIFPSNFWFSASQKLGYLPAKILGFEPNTFQFDHFLQGRFLELIFASLFLLIIIFIIISIKKFRNNFYLKLQIFGFLFVVINSLIYALSPGRSGIVTIIDGRNLYFCLLGTIIFAFSTFELYKLKRFTRQIGALLLVIVLFLNVTYLFKEIYSLVTVGQVRSSILSQTKKYFPALQDKTVFFVKSDTSYYGLPENIHIPPFQSGFGQTLLVWYSHDETLPKKFYANYYLWPIDSQGYIESEGRGFGYYREYSDLLESVKKNEIPVESVVSFSWESTPEALINITSEIQLKLKNDIKKDN